jgi:uncharacterized protein YcgI (DUF1989 family)
MRKTSDFLVPARTGTAFALAKGQFVKVIDVEGYQVADLVAFGAQDRSEHLCTAATIDRNGSIAVGKGDCLFSNLYEKMLLVHEDTVGRHDLIHPACSPGMYRSQYGILHYHPNCRDNLMEALGRASCAPEHLPVPFNVFMNVSIDADGKVRVEAPLSRKGDHVMLQALTDLLVAVSACSVDLSPCNNYACKPIRIEVWEES